MSSPSEEVTCSRHEFLSEPFDKVIYTSGNRKLSEVTLLLEAALELRFSGK
jgi:hypothetical protein